jgi:hypothetical protein
MQPRFWSSTLLCCRFIKFYLCQGNGTVGTLHSQKFSLKLAMALMRSVSSIHTIAAFGSQHVYGLCGLLSSRPNGSISVDSLRT